MTAVERSRVDENPSKREIATRMRMLDYIPHIYLFNDRTGREERIPGIVVHIGIGEVGVIFADLHGMYRTSRATIGGKSVSTAGDIEELTPEEYSDYQNRAIEKIRLEVEKQRTGRKKGVATRFAP